MKVADILKTKGPAVKMVRPDETAKAFAAHLKDERIGAMIVSQWQRVGRHHLRARPGLWPSHLWR